jgi:hypothetical protein
MANNTGAGSFWKNSILGRGWNDLTNWGSDIYQSTSNWWDSSFKDLNVPTEFKTGISGRTIDVPDFAKQPIGGTGFDWWDTTSSVASEAWSAGKGVFQFGKEVADYLSPVGEVLDWAKRNYQFLPKEVQDVLGGKSKDRESMEKTRRLLAEQQAISARAAGRKTAISAAASRPIERPTRVAPYNPRNAMRGNPLMRRAIEQAEKNKRIRETMLSQVAKGRQTITNNQVKDIYTYLSRRG